VVSLSPSRQKPGLGNDHFIPNLFKFIIIVSILKASLSNLRGKELVRMNMHCELEGYAVKRKWFNCGTI
jgi:hypothetical protein